MLQRDADVVGWRFLCVCAFDGFLLWFRVAYAKPEQETIECNGSTRPRPVLVLKEDKGKAAACQTTTSLQQGQGS